MKNKKISSPFRELCNSIAHFVKENKVVLFAIFIISIVGYGFEITNFSLTIDEESELARAFQQPFSNVEIWHIGNLRFVLGWLRSVFSINGVFIPYITTLMGVFWLGASALLWCVLVKKHYPGAGKVALVGFIAMYMTVPFVIAEWLIFGITCDIMFFGNFLVTLALFFLLFDAKENKNPWYKVFAALAAFLAVNIYQAFAGVFVIGFGAMALLWLLTREDKKEITLKKVVGFSIPYVVAGIIAVAGYYLFTKILSLVYKVNSTYVDGMFTWGKEGFSKGLHNVIGSIYRAIGPKNSYGSIIVLITIVLLVLATIVYFFRNRNRQGVAVTLSAAFFTLSIFALPIILGLNTPVRMLLTLLPFMGVSWFLFLHYSQRVKGLHVAAVVLAGYFVCQQVLLLNSFFYSSHTMSQTDQWNTKMIAHDILKKNNGQYPEVPVIFVGKHQEEIPQAVKVDSVGGSMINWQGTNVRIYDIMYLQGFQFAEYNGRKYTTYWEDVNLVQKAEEVAANMPLWPADDSIVITDELVVVKLAQNSP